MASFTDANQSRGTWFTTSAAGFNQAAFNLFDFTTGALDATQHPDFSSTGAAMDFGFASRLTVSGVPGVNSIDGTFGFDNLSITVNNNSAAVSEPGALPLLGLAAFLISAFSRRCG